MTRRGFLGALAALPFLGFLKPEPIVVTNTRRQVFIGAAAAELKYNPTTRIVIGREPRHVSWEE